MKSRLTAAKKFNVGIRMDKNAIRVEIDKIDGQILDLLARRISCAKEIGAMKSKNGESVYAPGGKRSFSKISPTKTGAEYPKTR